VANSDDTAAPPDAPFLGRPGLCPYCGVALPARPEDVGEAVYALPFGEGGRSMAVRCRECGGFCVAPLGAAGPEGRGFEAVVWTRWLPPGASGARV
jgi:hypothetical protein